MSIDPQARQVLDNNKLLPAMETLSVDAARKRCRDAFCTKEVPEFVKTIQNRTIDVLIDHTIQKIPVRTYTPETLPLLPVLVYFHGGGFVVNNLKTPDICFQLLFYPALDYYEPGTPSYQKFSTGYSLNRQTMIWFFNHYLPKEFDRDDPYLFHPKKPIYFM